MHTSENSSAPQPPPQEQSYLFLLALIVFSVFNLKRDLPRAWEVPGPTSKMEVRKAPGVFLVKKKK